MRQTQTLEDMFISENYISLQYLRMYKYLSKNSDVLLNCVWYCNDVRYSQFSKVSLLREQEFLLITQLDVVSLEPLNFLKMKTP